MPDLAALPKPRALHGPTFENNPAEILHFPDSSLAVADWGGGPAWRVWVDGSQPPQQLPAATTKASAVIPLGDGLLIVSYRENRVERTGSIAWKRTDLKSPWSAVVVGDTALVTEIGAGLVVQLDLRTGTTIKVFCKVMSPVGIAVGPTGELFVASRSFNSLVYVSTETVIS